MTNKVFGIVILGVGLLFLLTNIGVIEMNIGTFISMYWPLIIIYIGLRQVLRGFIYFVKKLSDGKWRFNKLFWGALILAFGLVIQGNKLEYFQISMGEFWGWLWPILIIYFGISLIFNRKSGLIVVDLSEFGDEDKIKPFEKEKSFKTSSNSKQKLMIGDIRLGKSPWQIDEMKTWVGVGDISLDLSTAMLKEGVNTIDLSGGIGDVKIFVPEDLPIKINADVKLGEVKIFDNKQAGTSRFVSYESENYQNAEKKVQIYIQLSIGDIKVKRVD
ncbi:hypothetical protein DS745_18145 [Anaerobacillus alkaliphilus]|uniref:Cell wall-active antibiotics response LiaF-like C-terminal domain-containing protein n=1 Tax=Anaerobacillus alkaliphilus TaxID=1548597 RepID=A0A4Q0VQR3_9BACI|nr:cell wall-active antibiotics response protein LiaF [Anaerobacillus alkaliphilus]RXI98257.1 hypothetical protein DS745_18145 [Anaerobacillus alkaliphilus]